MGDEPADREELNVADTRPAMMLGVIPMELGTALFVGMFAINNLMHSLLMGPCVVGPFAFLAVVLVRRDYNGVRVFFIWMRNLTVMWGAYEWGGSTVSPFSKGEPPEREIPDHAF